MGKLVEFTPLQLHCVTRRLTTAAPTFGYDDSDDPDPCDLGHLFDFLYQLKRVKVEQSVISVSLYQIKLFFSRFVRKVILPVQVARRVHLLKTTS